MNLILYDFQFVRIELIEKLMKTYDIFFALAKISGKSAK